MLHRTLSLILLLLATTVVSAQSLTDADIQKWAKAYQAVTQWAESTDIDEKLDADKEATDYSHLFTQMMSQSKGESYYGDLVGVLKKSGYSDPQQWASVGDRIMMAFLANQMEGNEAEMQMQLQQAKALMDSGMVPPEQKAMMEQMLNESSKALEAAKQAPADDKQAVKRNEALLKSMLDVEA